MSFAYLIKIAIRNILIVNRVRYLFVVLLLVMSIILGMMGMGFVDGMEYGILRDQRNIISSDIVYHPIDQKDYQIVSVDTFQNIQNQVSDVWTVRLHSIATIHLPSSYSSVVHINGYTDRDASVFVHDEFQVAGIWNGESNTVAIGVGLAKKHDLHLGDRIILELQTIQGNLTAKTIEIEAIIDTGNFAFREVLWMPYDELAEMMGGSIATSIHIRNIGNCQQAPHIEHWNCSTTKEAAIGMLQINAIRKSVFSMILGVLWFLSFSSFFHISWMSIHERRLEFYILRTLGISFLKLIQLIIFEGFLIGSIAIFMALPMSYFLCDVLFAEGITLDGLSSSLGSIPLPQKIYILFDTYRALAISLFCLLISIVIPLPALFWIRFRRGNLC